MIADASTELPLFTIDSKETLRKFLEDSLFSQPTSALVRLYQRGPIVIHDDVNRVWCVEAMWADALNLHLNVNKLAEMELEWRETPWRMELRPTLIN